MNQLIELQKNSIIVADTGDVQSIIEYKPQDATTNPSLIFKAAQLDVYQPLVSKALAWAQAQNFSDATHWQMAAEYLGVLIGAEISNIVPGVVSTEVDARLSFDTRASYEKAQQIISAYEALGVSRDKILIKIAATWQGIAAAQQLEALGIRCNLTLIFNLAQSRACAAANVYLISPFVGRISDWHKARNESFAVAQDPGVVSVKNIHALYRKLNAKTIVMAASFRSVEQILELNGCERLTIAPDLLAALQHRTMDISTDINHLDAADNQIDDIDELSISESEFLWQLNENEMASEKLADGIRRFAHDSVRLEAFLKTI